MDIHSVIVKDDRVYVLLDEGQRVEFKCACGLALKAGDKATLFDLITRLEALAVQWQVNSEAWCKGFGEEADEHSLHHVQGEAIIE